MIELLKKVPKKSYWSDYKKNDHVQHMIIDFKKKESEISKSEKRICSDLINDFQIFLRAIQEFLYNLNRKLHLRIEAWITN